MRRHVEALFRLDDGGRLVDVNESGGARAPRFFLGRTAQGARCWFRDDLEPGLIEDLLDLANSLTPQIQSEADPDLATPFVELLEARVPVEKIWMGPAYTFPSSLPEHDATAVITSANVGVLWPYFEDWLDDVQPGLPFTAVLEEGNAVSLCCSVRVTADAHEAGVETHTDFRGRGYAALATSAWATIVRRGGSVPLYSTSWENTASRAVASKLGLVQFGVDLHVT